MNINPDPEGPARLESLAQQAKRYALHMIQTTGSVPPTVIADTADGFIFCMPSGMPDEAAKDRFADVARCQRSGRSQSRTPETRDVRGEPGT
ncbi:MAG: hypothetical protein WCK77_23045 [Verrucomicrobiota bacterium]